MSLQLMHDAAMVKCKLIAAVMLLLCLNRWWHHGSKPVVEVRSNEVIIGCCQQTYRMPCASC